jgi:hypothetical protein
MEGVQTGTELGIIVIAHRLPRHRFPHKRKSGNFSFQRIEPQCHCPGTLQTVQKILEFIPQLISHSFQKHFGQHGSILQFFVAFIIAQQAFPCKWRKNEASEPNYIIFTENSRQKSESFIAD